MTSHTHDVLRLSLDWELWMIEQLLFTSQRDDIIQVLASQGIDPDIAAATVAELYEAPGFKRLQARLGQARLALQLQHLQQSLAQQSVDVRADIGPDPFLHEHWVPSRPLILTHTMRHVRAVETWTLEHLARTYSDTDVQVNVQRTQATQSRDVENIQAVERFATLVERIYAAPSNEFYIVSRNGILSLPAFAALWDDLAPLPALLVPPEPPRGVALWLGPAGTVTPAHFDPHNVLLTQVEGRKRVRLAPRISVESHQHLDGYYLNGTLDDVFGDDVVEVILEPGHALFIPVGWFHEVTALDPSMTLSFMNFAWNNNFHGLVPG